MLDGHQPSTFDVFISYARQDAAVAGEIARALEAAGIHVWIDQAELSPGEPWLRCLDYAVGGADAFIAVLPGNSRDERRVEELAATAGAIQRRGTDVIPVLLPPADIHDVAGWPRLSTPAQTLATRWQTGSGSARRLT